jgi:hypothetical protein
MDPEELLVLLDQVAEKYADFVPDESINPSPWVY